MWLEELTPTDLNKSTVLQERVKKCKAYREGSSRPATQKLANYPTLFGERRQPENSYLCIPSVVSETRPFFTVQQLDSVVVASNLAFTVDDPSGLSFALASSSMFIAWQKITGGRLKSDLRFSGTLVWNNFPVPALNESDRQKIISAGHKIEQARAKYADLTLADLYNPLLMKPELRKAHEELDRAVDQAFGASRKLTTETKRLELLFANYQAALKKG